MLPPEMTADLTRAGRALAQVSPTALAEAAGLSKVRLRRFEKGLADLEPDELTNIEKALAEFGVVIVWPDEFGGIGVRRSFGGVRPGQLEVGADSDDDRGGPSA